MIKKGSVVNECNIMRYAWGVVCKGLLLRVFLFFLFGGGALITNSRRG